MTREERLLELLDVDDSEMHHTFAGDNKFLIIRRKANIEKWPHRNWGLEGTYYVVFSEHRNRYIFRINWRTMRDNNTATRRLVKGRMRQALLNVLLRYELGK